MPPPVARHFPRLYSWIQQSKDELKQVYTTANAHDLDKQGRQRITIQAEGREVDAETILSGVHFHLDEEYVYLLKNLTEHSITAIYASNLNDGFLVTKLSQSEDLPEPVQAAVSALSEQLNAIPPSTDIRQPTEQPEAL